MTLIANLAILVLAAFVGLAVISKVPNTLHTPLMSGTNAIHGAVLIGAQVVLCPAERPSLVIQTILSGAGVAGTVSDLAACGGAGPTTGPVYTGVKTSGE